MLSVTRLLAALDAKRTELGLTWRQTATEVGVSPSSFSRMKDGAVPSLEGAMAMSEWVGQPLDTFALKRGEADFAVTGDTDLPVADRSREWDGAEAKRRVFDWATEDGELDTAKVARAFVIRRNDEDPTTQGAYSLGFADVIDGTLTIVPAGVFATAGGRGIDSVDGIPDNERERARDRICTLYERVADALDDDDLECPFNRDDEDEGDTVAAAGSLEMMEAQEDGRTPFARGTARNRRMPPPPRSTPLRTMTS